MFVWSENLLAADSNQPPVRVHLHMRAPTSVRFNTDSTTEPSYKGVPIGQWIQSHSAINPIRLELGKLLTLTQVVDNENGYVVRFELPISYDAMQSNGWFLQLGGLNKSGDFVELYAAHWQRATNGRCLLVWNTAYDPPKNYNLRARLICEGHKMDWNSIYVIGPALSFCSSNDCQFFAGSSMFDSKSAYLDAKLRESVASYRIELTTSDGKHLKTITGTTTNGMVREEWNLIDERGKKFEGDDINSQFYITFPPHSKTNSTTKPTFKKVGTKKN